MKFPTHLGESWAAWPMPLDCGLVVDVARGRSKGNVVLARVDTTTHVLHLLWDPAVNLPLGVRVDCCPTREAATVHLPSGPRVAMVAEATEIAPDSIGGACRWVACYAMELMALAASAAHLEPVARRMVKRARRLGYRPLDGVVERTPGHS